MVEELRPSLLWVYLSTAYSLSVFFEIKGPWRLQIKSISAVVAPMNVRPSEIRFFLKKKILTWKLWGLQKYARLPSWTDSLPHSRPCPEQLQLEEHFLFEDLLMPSYAQRAYSVLVISVTDKSTSPKKTKKHSGEKRSFWSRSSRISNVAGREPPSRAFNSYSLLLSSGEAFRKFPRK